MLRVYTGDSYNTIKNLTARYKFPEHRKAPFEQIDWMDYHLPEFKKDDVSIITFSPYILNYLNLLLASGKLKAEELEVTDYYDYGYSEISGTDLLIKNESGNYVVDTSGFSDPISWIYSHIKNYTT